MIHKGDKKMERNFRYDVMAEIKERWSPRAFSKDKISRADIHTLLEAARYAPSCFNEQPWRFLIADTEDSLTKMRSVLNEKNQVWANKAPVLILICAQKTFSHNDKDNYWNMFDAGTAWGFLSLEAHRIGLITHAMGGFSRKKAAEVFEIAEDLDIITVVALGKMGDPSLLPEELKKEEFPKTRKEIEDFLL